MTKHQQIIDYRKKHPDANYTEIGKAVGCHKGYVCETLNPSVYQNKLAKRNAKKRNYKQILVAEAGGACIKCGYNKYIEVLDFHHLDPDEKDFSLSNNNRSLKALREEAAKCILLCSNCHRELHCVKNPIDNHGRL